MASAAQMVYKGGDKSLSNPALPYVRIGGGKPPSRIALQEGNCCCIARCRTLEALALQPEVDDPVLSSLCKLLCSLLKVPAAGGSLTS